MKIYDPILTCEQAQALEYKILGTSDNESFVAMTRAGTGIAKMFLDEFAGLLPASPVILVLAGGGHNGGDSLIAAREIVLKFPNAHVTVVHTGIEKQRKNTKRSLAALQKTVIEQNFELLNSSYLGQIAARRFDLVIDGIVGMNFKPPARQSMIEEITTANGLKAKIRISVDIPSGAYDAPPQDPVFRADVTYATGICKDVLFQKFNRPFVGRIRYVDVGFFENGNAAEFLASSKNFITRPDALDFLKDLRPAISDKRTYGHLFIVAGSRSFPGAALLSARSALRAGVGLVSVFVPETLAPSFAAVEPSAIWVGCPEDESGSTALDALGIIRPKLKAATGILAGPGITNSPETQALIAELLKISPGIPALLDADAVREPLVKLFAERNAPALITPHEGEILRIAPDASDESLLKACSDYKCSIALKASVTRVSDGEIIVRQVRGNPTLARAGSGDILSGIGGALISNRTLKFERQALCAGVCASQCLGIAAEKAFAKLGETAVATSDIVQFIPAALE